MAKQIEISVYGVGSAALGGNAGETISIPTQGIFVLPSSKSFNGVVCQSEIQIYPSGLNQASDSFYSSESVADILAKANAGSETGLVLTWDSISNVPVADANSVEDWNTFFDLPTNGTPFTSVEVVDNNVKLYGGNNVSIKNSLFASNSYLISIKDECNCVIQIGNNSFDTCNLLNYINFPLLTTIGLRAFRDCSSLTNLYFPLLQTIGFQSFLRCNNVSNINMPNLIYVSDYGFSGMSQLTNISMPSCQSLGSTVNYDNVFNTIGKTINLTIPSLLMTCNEGNPDGDIQYLQANNTVNITTV